MIGNWFLVFDDEGHLLCSACPEWADYLASKGIPAYPFHFAPIEDEL